MMIVMICNEYGNQTCDDKVYVLRTEEVKVSLSLKVELLKWVLNEEPPYKCLFLICFPPAALSIKRKLSAVSLVCLRKIASFFNEEKMNIVSARGQAKCKFYEGETQKDFWRKSVFFIMLSSLLPDHQSRNKLEVTLTDVFPLLQFHFLSCIEPLCYCKIIP